MDKAQHEELASLRAHVQQLQDLEDIRNLQIRFWRACDGDFLNGPTHAPDEIADLFTPDGVWEREAVEVLGHSLPGSIARGRAEIIEWFLAAQARQPFVLHIGGMPLITVDGDTATATWRVMNGSTALSGGAFWGAGAYANEYRRTAEGWRIVHSRMTPVFRASFDGPGWADQRYAAYVS